ncbi:phosphatase PAP2 family protein [bacterium]|nr:phosphatase PAP2 family protein [bacterium]
MRHHTAQTYRLTIALVLVYLCMTVSGVHAQGRVSGAIDHDFDVFVDDAGDIFSAPADFDGRDWLTAGLIAAAGVAAWTVDDDVRSWSQEHRTEATDDWLVVGDYYGSGLTGGVLGLGMYGGGLAFDDEWTRVTGRMIIQSQIYSTFITHLLKTILGRARPFTDEGKGAFHFFRFDEAYWSHPSGHATSAFALSSTLSRRVGSLPLSVFLYTFSTVTVLQRVMADKHWLSDTIVGAAIGTVVGLAVVQLEESREVEDSDRYPISAGFSPHRPAVRIILPL